MRTVEKQLAFGPLTLLLPAGCSDDKKECEITCREGFKTTQDGSCDASAITSLAAVHGGQCTRVQHN